MQGLLLGDFFFTRLRRQALWSKRLFWVVSAIEHSETISDKLFDIIKKSRRLLLVLFLSRGVYENSRFLGYKLRKGSHSLKLSQRFESRVECFWFGRAIISIMSRLLERGSELKVQFQSPPIITGNDEYLAKASHKRAKKPGSL